MYTASLSRNGAAFYKKSRIYLKHSKPLADEPEELFSELLLKAARLFFRQMNTQTIPAIISVKKKVTIAISNAAATLPSSSVAQSAIMLDIRVATAPLRISSKPLTHLLLAEKPEPLSKIAASIAAITNADIPKQIHKRAAVFAIYPK